MGSPQKAELFRKQAEGREGIRLQSRGFHGSPQRLETTELTRGRGELPECRLTGVRLLPEIAENTRKQGAWPKLSDPSEYFSSNLNALRLGSDAMQEVLGHSPSEDQYKKVTEMVCFIITASRPRRCHGTEPMIGAQSGEGSRGSGSEKASRRISMVNSQQPSEPTSATLSQGSIFIPPPPHSSLTLFSAPQKPRHRTSSL